jgi:hypothetical protein
MREHPDHIVYFGGEQIAVLKSDMTRSSFKMDVDPSVLVFAGGGLEPGIVICRCKKEREDDEEKNKPSFHGYLVW